MGGIIGRRGGNGKAVIPECTGNYMPNPTAKTVNPLDQTALENISVLAQMRKQGPGYDSRPGAA